jgi:hypothetical protein
MMMLASTARAAILVFALLAASASARADDLADFNAAVEKAAAHDRVAIGYLRNGNLDLALVEIDRLREAWRTLFNRFSGRQPHVFDGNPRYVATMTDIATRLVSLDLMVQMGKPDGARKTLIGIREDLYRLRKSAGIVVLADCIYDANAAMDALMAYNDPKIDLRKPGVSDAIAAKARAYSDIINRCDSTAGKTVRQSPEFRRLVDGVRHGLVPLPHALVTRDAGELHRILIELRSFDNLMAFRFG